MRSIAFLVVGLLLAAGCGDSPARPEDPLTVLAATSLGKALTGALPADARVSTGGSDELAAQVRQGVPADLYLAANTELPAALAREGLVERPVVFAANELVLAVPLGSQRVRSLEDLARRDVAIAVGSPSVPVGRYTRSVIERLDDDVARRVLANVRTQEPDVAGVVGKLRAGAVDAGFVYATDVRAAGGAIEAIPLPVPLRPEIRYAGAVVRGSARAPAARLALAALRGSAALRAAGFAVPPED